MYFEEKGRVNTEATARMAIKKAGECGISHIVVASNEGYTADFFKGCRQKVICITHPDGFREPGKNEMAEENRKSLEDCGIRVYTASLLFGGVETGLRKKFQGLYPAGIMANTLRLFGQGMKVCVEIAVMALDAGLIPYGKEIIAVGGTGRGADTAIIVRPAHAFDILDTWVSEVICKPK
jgi:uncharacterized protein